MDTMDRRVLDWLRQQGEYYALGWCEEPEAPLLRRAGRALRRQLELCALPAWRGEVLYPAGAFDLYAQGQAFRFNYSYPVTVDGAAWERRLQSCPAELRPQVEAMGAELAWHAGVSGPIAPEFRLGGCGYTHSILNYGRIVREGLARYAARVDAGSTAAPGERADLFRALQDVLAGIRAVHARLIARLEGAETGAVRDRLLAALQRVPEQPARTFYEGLVAVNLAFYLDGCDSLGRFDQVLGALYEADLAAGRLTEAEGEQWVRLLWQSVDANSGWNTALGGSQAGGAPAYNRLTVACLRAARGLRRPNLALRIRRDMPAEVWEATLDTIASGCGLPALYNEEAYLANLGATGLVGNLRDLPDLAFGGCTETMVHGLSNVGSLDAGISLIGILTRTLRRELPGAASFDELWQRYQDDLASDIARLVAGVNENQRLRAERMPQLVRTLFVDDCIDRGIEYNAGGARYNWSVINICGLSNAVDSLAAVRELVFERREMSGAELWQALAADFRGYGALRSRVGRCPRFGNDDPRADGLAADLSRFVFGEFARYTPWRGGRFLPGTLMFTTYADAGRGVMATPDGRLADTAIADSAGPVAGRDRTGPTAMMRSVASLDMRGAPGTLVVNARLDARLFRAPADRARVRDLVQAYFALGNMQLQVNVVDQQTLTRAMADPESYRDLVVRVGGFSEYWGALSPELRQSILERTLLEIGLEK